MDRWAAMRAFVSVVEQGSFVAAAARLGVSTSALSRQVADLEEHLGARLLNRTTRRLSLTEGGQAFFERSVPLLNELDEAEAMVSQSAATPRGTLKLTCSNSLAQQLIAPAIARFAELYPDVNFDLVVADRLIDLVDEGFDLAIRAGKVGSDQLVARRLGGMELLVCAAPAYLATHGTPETPADLGGHSTLTYAYASTPGIWQLSGPGGEQEVRVGGRLHANSGEALIAAAVAGLGIVCEPDFMVASEVADGRLVRLLARYRAMRGDIWAVYPSRRHLSQKVRLFVDHLSLTFASSPLGSPVAPRPSPSSHQ
jgi:DNA-binding transcriptional LysR family regulator